MNRDYIEANRASLEKLESVVRGLSAADLIRSNAGGWTVAALLVHLAFWDQRMVVLLNRWLAEGVSESPVDPDMINDSMMPIALGMDPQAAVRRCRELAAAADAAMARISDELLAEIVASGNHYRYNRSLHRLGHLAEIDAILAS